MTRLPERRAIHQPLDEKADFGRPDHHLGGEGTVRVGG
jgi:hypothetical protein